MATVRSMMTVSRKVTNSTATSERGFFIRARNVRHSLMLYDTTTSTPARQAIGIYCASGIRKRKISSSTTAWMTPATGVRPPLLILVIVRAMAPVAGMPPNRGVTTLAIPWATSSWLELCLSPVTPSATVADSSDSMAPSTAMVIAAGSSPFIPSHERAGMTASGSWELIVNRSPMVSTESIPA